MPLQVQRHGVDRATADAMTRRARDGARCVLWKIAAAKHLIKNYSSFTPPYFHDRLNELDELNELTRAHGI